MPQTFDQIDTANRTPRVAMEHDTKSGVKTIQPDDPLVLLVGQALATATQPVNVPYPINREFDAEDGSGAGSVIHRMAIAAFKANPGARIIALPVADGGGAAAATEDVTLATNASADSAGFLDIGNDTVQYDIVKADTPTQQAVKLVAAIAANTALPVTAANLAGVVTVTAKNKGPVGNGLLLAFRFRNACATTVALSSGDGRLAGGATEPTLTTALANAFPKRYHWPALASAASTQGQALRDHNKDAGDAEDMRGQVGLQVINGSLATATTLAAALNHERMETWAIRNSPTWFPEIVAAIAATQARETIPNRPMNGVEVVGVKPPPVKDRWTGTELKNLLAGGVSPLKVVTGDKVVMCRAVTTRVLSDGGLSDYTLFGQEVIRGLDYSRDQYVLMFDRNYGRVRWADNPDEDTDLPGDVAWPSKVEADLLGVARQLQAAGVIQRVEALQAEFKAEKTASDECQFSVPSDVIEGLHKLYGKQILIRRPLSS